jgi:predicted dehydrogenase
MRTVIVGCGQIADAHIAEVRKIQGTTIEAVCDLNYHMAEQAAARLKIRGVYTDLDRMFKEVKPHVVHITTPPASHLAIGRKAIKYGAHAYIEKPFTANVAEAEELVDLSKRCGKLLCVGHGSAFDPAFLRLQAAVANGKLGEPVHLDTVMGYNLNGPFGVLFMADPSHWVHQLPGGNAQNNISHPLSLVMPFMPDPRPRVMARGFRLRNKRYGDIRDRFFDELRVMLVGDRTTASLVFTSSARPVQLSVTYFGTLAQASVSIDGRTYRTVRGASMPGPFARVQWAYREAAEANREFLRHANDLCRARLHYFQGMHELIRRFYLAIEGRGVMPIPMSEAVRTTRIMDDIFGAIQEEG